MECVRSVRYPHINEENAPPLSDLITPVTVLWNICEQRLHEKHDLIRLFEDDIRRLEQLERDDILGTHLVASFPDLPRISITNIAESLGSRKEHLPAVAKLCLHLTGEEKIDGKTWSGNSIIELEKQGSEFTGWTINITTYGRGLRGYLIRRFMGARTGRLGPRPKPLDYLPGNWEDILAEIDQ